MSEDQINALPECIRPHARALVQLDKDLGIDPPDDETVEILAWRRWAGALDNEELGDFVIVLQGLFRRGDEESTKIREKLYEVAIRLKRHCSYKANLRPSARIAAAIRALKERA